MRSLSLVLIAATLASCTTAPPQPLQRSERAQAELHTLLAGRVAGTPQSCLPYARPENMIVVDDNTVFYRTGSRLYRQDFNGGQCNNLGSGHYALVTRQYSGSLCRGDIAQVLDVSNGIQVGSCVMGDFVPYSKIR
jgi:hypothetical protein